VRDGGDSGRRRVSSGGPWESIAGYSRAIVVGDTCWVSGTTDAGPDGRTQHPGDVVAQARAVFGIIERALAEAGFALEDVVRTRMFATDPASFDVLLKVHGEVFGAIRPAATLVGVTALIEPSVLVEFEGDARRG
jgi:enamine deaminase RidA (YjgF/YER057c/UK114 family)